MDQIYFCLSLALGCGGMALELMAAGVLWKALRRQNAGQKNMKREELPEEQESRRMAAEAQRLYEQGFVNLMRYDGSPGRKEREEL